MNCEYLVSSRAGEPLEYSVQGKVTNWGEWTAWECNHSSAFNDEGCPFLDNFDAECPIKENQKMNLELWAVRQLAGDREDKYARIRELMLEAE